MYLFLVLILRTKIFEKSGTITSIMVDFHAYIAYIRKEAVSFNNIGIHKKDYKFM